jgi:hypothetical protein
MDFIEGLPKVGGKSVILTVVDRFSKYAHFIALGHPYTATTVARVYWPCLASIVSDRDSCLLAMSSVTSSRWRVSNSV